MKLEIISPQAVFVGGFLSLPFLVANTIAVTGIDPAYTWLSGLGPYIIFSVLALGLLGGIAALIPVFQTGTDGERRFFLVNAVLGVGLIAFFIVIGYALGEEIYRCDVLRIPNCD